MNQSQNLCDQVNKLFKAMYTRDRNERIRAKEELRKLSRAQVVEILRDMLGNPDGNIRGDAAEELLRIDLGIGILLMLPLLDDPVPYFRQHICGLLHDFGDESVVDPLIRVILNDSDSDVRYTACYALGEVGDARAIPSLQWVHQNDLGTDYVDRPVSEMAREAIEEILERSKSSL